MEDVVDIGHHFTKPELLETALTHRSFRVGQGKHYERLEFLGDAVLDLLMSEWLMERYPEASEGQLSRMRSELVNRDTLARLARMLGLSEFIKVGKGENREADRARASILGDVFEALVGAIFLDAGLPAAKDWVLTAFSKLLAEGFDPAQYRDYKSLLQEYTQGNHLQLPAYTLVSEQGPDHNKIFTVCCALPDGVLCEGQGSTKKQAEQAAAFETLKRLGKVEVGNA
jgi:ribonuclease-3